MNKNFFYYMAVAIIFISGAFCFFFLGALLNKFEGNFLFLLGGHLIVISVFSLLLILKWTRDIKRKDGNQEYTSKKVEGLKIKYNVYKTSDYSVVNNCFVLRPDKDAESFVALYSYALVTKNRELQKDLFSWLHDISVQGKMK